MKTDAEIRRDIESELRWDPSINDTRIGVTVSNGVLTLTGDVPTTLIGGRQMISPGALAGCVPSRTTSRSRFPKPARVRTRTSPRRQQTRCNGTSR